MNGRTFFQNPPKREKKTHRKVFTPVTDLRKDLLAAYTMAKQALTKLGKCSREDLKKALSLPRPGVKASP